MNPSTAPGLGVKVNCQNWGCGYTYGFRVPLLVVSPFTKVGYVSGDTRTFGEQFPYIHDFGSVLAFIENNFGLGIGNINLAYPFADAHAPDNLPPNIPLSDFFLFAYRSFTQINVIYDVPYFQSYPGAPQGPGDGGSED